MFHRSMWIVFCSPFQNRLRQQLAIKKQHFSFFFFFRNCFKKSTIWGENFSARILSTLWIQILNTVVLPGKVLEFLVKV